MTMWLLIHDDMGDKNDDIIVVYDGMTTTTTMVIHVMMIRLCRK